MTQVQHIEDALRAMAGALSDDPSTMIDYRQVVENALGAPDRPDPAAMTDLSITLALRMRWERESRGWSQAELAGRCNVAPSAISHWETGRRLMTITNLGLVAAALGVTPGSLLEASP